MKVVVVASLAFSLTNFRGRLLEDIVAQGHHVIACAPEDDADVAGKLARMGVAYRRMPMARVGLNPFADLRTLWWLLRLFFGERPGLVLAYTQKPIIYAGIACRIARVPKFFAMVTGLGQAFGSEASAGLRRLVVALYRKALSGVTGVFVFNGADRGELLHHRIISPSTPVVQVPGTGVDLAHYAVAPLPPGPPRFLMIARLLRSKGVLEYFDAAEQVHRRCPEARFGLLGPLDPGPDGIHPPQLARLCEGGAVDYLGEVRDVRPHLADATVFVLPSWYREGLPRTILEAMAMGRPVITTDMPGCREPITPGVDGLLVPARSAAQLASAMLRFVDDPALAGKMGARAHETAATRFSVRRVNDILLSTMQLRQPGTVAASAQAMTAPRPVTAA